MKKILVALFLFTLPQVVFSQRFAGQIPVEKKYKFKEVYDSTYGINIYERLITALQADSVRNDKRGYACQGWVEDYYEGGALLHKGYYVDGQIKIFKNYYENGQLERDFKLVDYKKSKMDIYYMDGKLKVEMLFNEGEVLKETDYFPNGQIEYSEETDKDGVVKQRKSFYENGKPESTFEIIDKKKNKYSKKEFYENGNTKEEGILVYSETMLDYVKDGDWKGYDEKGNLTSHEIYIAGEMNEKKK